MCGQFVPSSGREQEEEGVAVAEKDGVQSLERAFTLLELMADDGGEVPLSRLAVGSGLPLSTIHRLIRTLVARGYVRQLPSRRYVLGPRLIHLGESSSRALSAWALPHLTDLVDGTGETANMAMLDGDRVVYVAQVPSRHSMRMFTEVGRRVHPHCTAVGKAVLSVAPEDEVRTLLARTGLPRHTASTITDVEEFLAQLDEVRERGYALDEGEQEVGVRCLAVRLPGSAVQMGLSISGPAPRMTDDLLAEAVPILRSAAQDLAATIA
jgi:IclR family acetate operon transcriptional repressor